MEKKIALSAETSLRSTFAFNKVNLHLKSSDGAKILKKICLLFSIPCFLKCEMPQCNKTKKQRRLTHTWRSPDGAHEFQSFEHTFPSNWAISTIQLMATSQTVKRLIVLCCGIKCCRSCSIYWPGNSWWHVISSAAVWTCCQLLPGQHKPPDRQHFIQPARNN